MGRRKREPSRGTWLRRPGPEADRDREALARMLKPHELAALGSYYWQGWARDEQLPPREAWRTWLIRAGRGFGKTRAGAEWVRDVARNDGNARIALVGASLTEVRNVMVEGDSGVLAAAPGALAPVYEPSLRKLTWENGAIAWLYSAGEPDTLRGPQHSHAWCDEIAKWENANDPAIDAWNNLQLTMRLGETPRVLATTTPRHTALMHRLSAQAKAGKVELRRVPRGASSQPAADPGRSLSAADHVATPTVLYAFELPWDGLGDGETRRAFAAVSSQSQGWPGAAIYLQQGSDLEPLGPSGRRRCVIGATASVLPPSAAGLLERTARLDVDLVSEDFALDAATAEELAAGANKVLVGSEVLQFARAERVAGNRWRISGLLRGRGGTEGAAMSGAPMGSSFVLLDGLARLLDPVRIGPSGPAMIAALGLADQEPVIAPLANPGLTRRPLSPVHGSANAAADGSLSLRWCRRARGAWIWQDGVEVPLVEQSESYSVGIGDPASPDVIWSVNEPRLHLDAAIWSDIVAHHAGKLLWVRQVGTASLSDPLLLTTIT